MPRPDPKDVVSQREWDEARVGYYETVKQAAIERRQRGKDILAEIRAKRAAAADKTKKIEENVEVKRKNKDENTGGIRRSANDENRSHGNGSIPDRNDSKVETSLPKLDNFGDSEMSDTDVEHASTEAVANKKDKAKQEAISSTNGTSKRKWVIPDSESEEEPNLKKPKVEIKLTPSDQADDDSSSDDESLAQRSLRYRRKLHPQRRRRIVELPSPQLRSGPLSSPPPSPANPPPSSPKFHSVKEPSLSPEPLFNGSGDDFVPPKARTTTTRNAKQVAARGQPRHGFMLYVGNKHNGIPNSLRSSSETFQEGRARKNKEAVDAKKDAEKQRRQKKTQKRLEEQTSVEAAVRAPRNALTQQHRLTASIETKMRRPRTGQSTRQEPTASGSDKHEQPKDTHSIPRTTEPRGRQQTNLSSRVELEDGEIPTTPPPLSTLSNIYENLFRRGEDRLPTPRVYASKMQNDTQRDSDSVFGRRGPIAARKAQPPPIAPAPTPPHKGPRGSGAHQNARHNARSSIGFYDSYRPHYY